MKRPLLACCFALTAQNAFAQAVCVVADPTSTPLNVRVAPNGTILGALNNGTRVSILNIVTDRGGERWALIAPLGPGKRGYVFRSFLDC